MRGGPRVYVRDATRKHRLDPRAVARRARRVLSELGYGHATLSLSFVGDRAMRRLNREHRGVDRATDVLSFPLFEPGALRAARRVPAELLLGDVVVSLDTAARQAAAYDATLAAEVDRLVVHGVLHLLGHDHEETRERARMEREERRLAVALGRIWPYP